MDKKDLLKKVNAYLDIDKNKSSQCCKELIGSWVESVIKFRSSNPADCCSSTMKNLLYFFMEDSFGSEYFSAKNAMFGELFEIRTQGFENRFLANIKLCKTYKAAYEKTELEYKQTFSKRRYSSYDSFRQIRSRKMKKKEA